MTFRWLFFKKNCEVFTEGQVMVKNIWFYFLYCWRGFPYSHLTSTCSKSTTETLEKVFSPFSSVSIVDFEQANVSGVSLLQSQKHFLNFWKLRAFWKLLKVEGKQNLEKKKGGGTIFWTIRERWGCGAIF